MIALLIFIAFWFIVYFIEGTHDSFITKETNQHPQPTSPQAKILANYYKGKWHTWDTYQFAIWHIIIALLLASSFFPLTFLLSTFSLILISVSIRIVAHDLFFDLGVNRSIFTIPTCQGKWDWWDCFIVWIDAKIGVPPFYLRFIPLFLSIIIHYLIFIR